MRGLHWLLAMSVVVAWVSGHWPPQHGFDLIHHGAGYLAGAVVVVRLLMGFVGTPYARFAQFVRGQASTIHYARQFLTGRAPRYLGHNPLGAWMVVALLAGTAALSLTGWLYTTEWLWGYAWLEQLHATLAWAVAVLVPLHLAGVALASWQHRENLVAAMVHGRKRPSDGDIR